MAPASGLLLAVLYANVAYFFAMSVAHWVGFKVPVLFIYYDVPFYAYQDKIISFCAATYALLNFAAVCNHSVVPFVIASLVLTTAGLSAINASDDLQQALPHQAPTTAYWMQTAMIGVLTAVIAILYASMPGEGKRKK